LSMLHDLTGNDKSKMVANEYLWCINFEVIYHPELITSGCIIQNPHCSVELGWNLIVQVIIGVAVEIRCYRLYANCEYVFSIRRPWSRIFYLWFGPPTFPYSFIQ